MLFTGESYPPAPQSQSVKHFPLWNVVYFSEII